MLGINKQAADDFTPSFLNARLADSALLFLGFNFKDTGFRLVLRNTLPRVDPDEKETWVGAQIPPEEDRYMRVQQARDYIEKTVGLSLKIYWGTTEDFITEFADHARRDGILLPAIPASGAIAA